MPRTTTAQRPWSLRMTNMEVVDEFSKHHQVDVNSTHTDDMTRCVVVIDEGHLPAKGISKKWRRFDSSTGSEAVRISM